MLFNLLLLGRLVVCDMIIDVVDDVDEVGLVDAIAVDKPNRSSVTRRG